MRDFVRTAAAAACDDERGLQKRVPRELDDIIIIIIKASLYQPWKNNVGSRGVARNVEMGS